MTNLTITGATTVETSREEFVLFAVQSKELTIPVIKAELMKLDVEFPIKAKKEVLAGLLFDRLESIQIEADRKAYAKQKEEREVKAREEGNKAFKELLEKKSAAGETPVAETKSEEEIKMMSEQEQINYKNMKALEKSRVANNPAFIKKGDSHGYVNHVSEKVKAQAREAVERYYANLGEHKVEILSVVPFDTPDKYGRIGYMDVVFPATFATIKIWMEDEKKYEWYDFTDFNYNQLASRKKWSLPYAPSGMEHSLEIGSGIIRLAIRENANKEAYVRLPMDKDDKNEGLFWDVFRTGDIRWDRPNSSNNGNVEAALTAALQFYWKELKRDNPMNRSEFGSSCMNCAHLQWFGMRDGVDDDMEISATPGVSIHGADIRDKAFTNHKSTRILNQPDVETLAQHGSSIPQAWCTKHKYFVDAEASDLINKLTQEERTHYVFENVDAETGRTTLEYRFQGRDEVIYKGKPIKTRDIRVEMTKTIQAGCVNYERNAYKGEHAIGAEIVAAREKMLDKAKTAEAKAAIRDSKAYKKPFVSSYWTTRADASRQAFETFMVVGSTPEWVPGFPAQVAGDEKVTNIRVAGRGVNVYFSPALFATMTQQDLRFMPAMKSFDEIESAFNKMVNLVFYAAFNRDKMNKTNFEKVVEMVYTAAPEGLDTKKQKRWDNAVYWFEQSLLWAAEREAARNRPAFMIKFYDSIESYIAAKGLDVSPQEIDLQARGVKEIHVEDVLQETFMRVEEEVLHEGFKEMFKENGLERGYEDLDPKDFVRFLDDVARDYVIDSLMDGSEFIVVGGQKGFERTEEEEFAREFFGARRNVEINEFSREQYLVAGALQHMLGREVTGLLYGVNRASNKVQEFLSLNVHEDVLQYVAEHAGLLKKD